MILTARNPEHLQRAPTELNALSTAALDATGFKLLQAFFDDLPAPVDHILVTGPGPYYAPLADLDLDKARREIEARLLLPLQVARYAVNKGPSGWVAAFHGRHGGPESGKGIRARLGSHGRIPP